MKTILSLAAFMSVTTFSYLTAFAYDRDGAISDNSMTFLLDTSGATGFGNDNGKLVDFILSATRIWMNHGNADISLNYGGSIAGGSDVWNDGASVVSFNPNNNGCGADTVAFARKEFDNDGTIAACDITFCEYSLSRTSSIYILQVLVHEMGHCLGFSALHSGDSKAVMYPIVDQRTTYLGQDDVSGLLSDPAYGYSSNATSLKAMYSNDAGASWTLLDSSLHAIATSSTRKPGLWDSGVSNRYAVSYSDTGSNLRVTVGDLNNVVVENVDTGGNTHNGSGVAWNGSRIVVVYRAASDGKLYSRVSNNSGATWSGYYQITNIMVSGSVDVAYSSWGLRYYAIAARGSDGVLLLYSTSDGANWTAEATLQDYAADGPSVACGLGTGWCTVLFSAASNLNTRLRQFGMPLGGGAATWTVGGGVITDGYWSTGETDVATMSGEVDYGVYTQSAECIPGLFLRGCSWTGRLDGTTGSHRYFDQESSFGAVAWGENYHEFMRVAPLR